MSAINRMLKRNESLLRGKTIKSVKCDIHRIDFEFEEGAGLTIQSDLWKDAPLGHGLLILEHNVDVDASADEKTPTKSQDV